MDVGVVQHLQDVNKWQDQGPLPNEACKWFEHPHSPLDQLVPGSGGVLEEVEGAADARLSQTEDRVGV